MIHPHPVLVSRRQFLLAAGSSATALVVGNGCRSRLSPRADGARPGRLFFTSQGRTGVIHADGTGLRITSPVRRATRFGRVVSTQTPNTQFTLMEYPQLPIILENRNLSMEKDAVVMDRFRGVQEGFVLQYEDGYFAGFRLGGAVFDNTAKLIRRFRGDNGEGHQANFLKALRSRKTSDLNAPILEGHVSSAVCHLGNISYRLGRPGDAQACQAALGNQPPVAEGFPRLVQSLEGIGVDLDKTPFALGPWLELDTQTGDILRTEGGDAGQLEQARRLGARNRTRPYVFPA
jgi:hypothetical protein